MAKLGGNNLQGSGFRNGRECGIASALTEDMGMLFHLLGLDTFELIELGDERSPALSWPLMSHAGPILDLHLLGYGTESRGVMLPADLLKKLYARFAEANPSGVRIVAGDGYLDYVPPGMSEAEAEELADEGKLYPTLTMDIHYARIEDHSRMPRLYELLPELLDAELLMRLAADPALDPALMAQAHKRGALSPNYGPRHPRWTPEWEAYAARQVRPGTPTA